jgi:hypothetical protein
MSYDEEALMEMLDRKDSRYLRDRFLNRMVHKHNMRYSKRSGR